MPRSSWRVAAHSRQGTWSCSGTRAIVGTRSTGAARHSAMSAARSSAAPCALCRPLLPLVWLEKGSLPLRLCAPPRRAPATGCPRCRARPKTRSHRSRPARARPPRRTWRAAAAQAVGAGGQLSGARGAQSPPNRALWDSTRGGRQSRCVPRRPGAPAAARLRGAEPRSVICAEGAHAPPRTNPLAGRSATRKPAEQHWPAARKSASATHTPWGRGMRGSWHTRAHAAVRHARHSRHACTRRRAAPSAKSQQADSP